jgi:cytochrome c-type biogenesis protein CcmF
LAALSGMLIMSEYFKHVNRLRKRHSENWTNAFWLPFKRNHRTYGGLLIHLGVVLMSLGIIGLEGLQQEIQVTLDRGGRAELAGYQFQFAGLEWQGDEGGISTTRAVVEVSRDETLIGVLYPQRDIYLEMGLAVTQPSTRSNLAKDIYAILVDYDAETQNAATFRLYINPLVNWLWIGVGVMTLGTLVALLPDEKRKPG